MKNLDYSNLAPGTAATASVSYTYDPVYSRLSTMTDGTGTTAYDYYPVGQLGALMPKTIDGPLTGTTDLITYTYQPDGNIATWKRQSGSNPATQFTLGYDPADQLTAATLALAAAPNTVSQRYSYQYDSAGNRTSQQAGNIVNTATANNASQLTNLSGGGKLLVTGTTNEPAKVKVNGQHSPSVRVVLRHETSTVVG